MVRSALSLLPRLWTNWITLLGSILATVAACILILGLAAELFVQSPNLYASTFAFLVAPGIFVLGLAIIPIGLAWEHRRTKPRTGPWVTLQAAFRTALEDKKVRAGIIAVGGVTVANIAIIGAVGNRALQHMDSVKFCGATCHMVMQPEYDAYRRSPHQKVSCVSCHIGGGASWAVKSKISGIRQLWAVAFDSFSRPIPAPVHELRPSRDTCEQCHWPGRFFGNRIRFRTNYSHDEANTPSVNAILLKIGGANPKSGEHSGIHWHVDEGTRVEYDALDGRREIIGQVRVFKGQDVIKVYNPPDRQGTIRETRSMDCVDCHNRPTHIFDLTPTDAINRVLAEGRIDRGIPYIAQSAVAVLSDDSQPRTGVQGLIRQALTRWYAEEQDDVQLTAQQFDDTARELALVYRANIYPESGIGWGTYPTHIGHRGEDNDTRGCFRCHNDEHETEGGEVLSQDCDLCHEVLHEEEGVETIPEPIRALMTADH